MVKRRTVRPASPGASKESIRSGSASIEREMAQEPPEVHTVQTLPSTNLPTTTSSTVAAAASGSRTVCRVPTNRGLPPPPHTVLGSNTAGSWCARLGGSQCTGAEPGLPTYFRRRKKKKKSSPPSSAGKGPESRRPALLLKLCRAQFLRRGGPVPSEIPSPTRHLQVPA